MAEIHPVLKGRQSRRSFSGVPPEPEKLEALIEAFRWAPSSGNKQPWRLIVVRSPEAHVKFDACLIESNRAWAPAAPVKIIILGNPEEQPERFGQDRWLLDCGLATRNMLIQGCDLGLTVHAMGGWEEEPVLKNFNAPPRSGWPPCSPSATPEGSRTSPRSSRKRRRHPPPGSPPKKSSFGTGSGNWGRPRR